MSCCVQEAEMDDLRRCGCESCYRRYQDLKRRAYEQRYRYDPYAALAAPYGRSPGMIGLDIMQADEIKRLTANIHQTGVKIMTTTKPTKPVDPAVKVIQDRVKCVQSTLDNQRKTVENYKNSIKTSATTIKSYGPSIKASEVEIAALNKALKKLGA
jgi:hypothetical protein